MDEIERQKEEVDDAQFAFDNALWNLENAMKDYLDSKNTLAREKNKLNEYEGRRN